MYSINHEMYAFALGEAYNNAECSESQIDDDEEEEEEDTD